MATTVEFTKRRGDTWIFDIPVTRRNAQSIVIEGSPTNGTWTALYTSEDGVSATTAPIAHNATNSAVQTAFEGLSNVDIGDVTVTGGPGPGTPWVVTINTDAAYPITVSGSFSGGSNVSIRAEPQPFNLTGASLYATFKTAVGLDDAADGVFQYSWIAGTADGITVANPTTGLAVLTVPDTETDDYAVNKYFFDVQVTDASGETTTIIPSNPADDATLTVKADITRATG